MLLAIILKNTFGQKMKKLFLLVLFISSFINAQENKNYLYLNSGITVYVPQKDGSFLRKDYVLKENDDIELYSSKEIYKPEDGKELDAFYKNAIASNNSKVEILRDFENYRNKVYQASDKVNKTKIRFCFYGSRLLVDKQSYFGNSPYNFANENLIIIPNNDNYNSNNYNSSEYGLKYKIYENFYNTGVNLFVIGTKIYPFNTANELLHNLFPNAEIKIAERKFSTQYFPYNLKITDKSNQNNNNFYSTYGVSDNLGKEIIPPIYDKIILSADAILVKEKDLWYFYDFFGNKLQNFLNLGL